MILALFHALFVVVCSDGALTARAGGRLHHFDLVHGYAVKKAKSQSMQLKREP